MKHPLLLQINTRCWLRGLSDTAGRPVTLGTVPDGVFEEWKTMGLSDLWLMGVWTTGPKARAIALAEPNIRKQCDAILPGWKESDMPGSPYAIAAYQVPPALGGDDELKAFRRRLKAAGIRLMLDFVPNHLGVDHPWVSSRPELFVQSGGQRRDAFSAQTREGELWLAHGRDPYWPGWTDTVQLDYRRADVWEAMTGLFLDVASRCDGARCDVAMLLLSDLFKKTWADWPMAKDAVAAEGEFWSQAISKVKKSRPGFMFLAESYWRTEARLQELGFDVTYDKTWLDELCARQPASVLGHFQSNSPDFIAHSAHFLENHDEPRIAARVSQSEHRAAALAMLTLPGMRFLHEGQLEGARLHLPVQLGVRPVEPVDEAVRVMYRDFLAAVNTNGVGLGEGRLLEARRAWEDNPSAENILLVFWEGEKGCPVLAAVNFAPHPAQCRVTLPLSADATRGWKLRDVLGSEVHERAVDELTGPGLFLDLPAHAAQLFAFEPA